MGGHGREFRLPGSWRGRLGGKSRVPRGGSKRPVHGGRFSPQACHDPQDAFPTGAAETPGCHLLEQTLPAAFVALMEGVQRGERCRLCGGGSRLIFQPSEQFGRTFPRRLGGEEPPHLHLWLDSRSAAAQELENDPPSGSGEMSGCGHYQRGVGGVAPQLPDVQGARENDPASPGERPTDKRTGLGRHRRSLCDRSHQPGRASASGRRIAPAGQFHRHEVAGGREGCCRCRWLGVYQHKRHLAIGQDRQITDADFDLRTSFGRKPAGLGEPSGDAGSQRLFGSRCREWR